MLRLTLTALVLAIPLAASAAGSGALVLDVSGTVEPAVAPFSDVAPGTELWLGSGATVIISHYAVCEEVTVTGGTIRVGQSGLSIKGEQRIDRQPVECVDRLSLTATDLTNAAVVTRSLNIKPTIGLAPEFVLAGQLDPRYDLVRVMQGRTVVAVLPVAGRRVVWPADLPTLTDGADYTFFVSGPGVQPFGATATASSGATARIVLAP